MITLLFWLAGGFAVAGMPPSLSDRVILKEDYQVLQRDASDRVSVVVALPAGAGSEAPSAVWIGGMGLAHVEQKSATGTGAASPIEPAAKATPAAAELSAQETTAKTKTANSARRRSGAYEDRLYTITITGRALDRDGLPVADAVIQVIDPDRGIQADVVLGKTKSAADGRYILHRISFPVLNPPASAAPKLRESRFEVSGWASGKAFAWHRTPVLPA